jgi:formylglycine-generating enzyme required for sulfatase activity/enamine deaminase RidA (YjgF/YER057c/UK114 family)
MSMKLALAAAAVLGVGFAPANAPAAQRAGSTFRDCPDCPQMVVVPPGRFIMGSPESEPVRDKDEGPQREVVIRNAFAISKFEVTRGQFRKFVTETGHQGARNCSVLTGTKSERVPAKSWEDTNSPQTDDHPVACISWFDAKAYVGWLARKTGKPYRLLSEAEWEYAARAGSAAKYSFGDDADQLCGYANVADDSAREAGGLANWTYVKCRDGYGLNTAPVGSFKPNRFGLHDMHGNVWEWVEDCAHETYDGAPTDATAWVAGDCRGRVDRGGGYYNNRGTNRSSERAFFPPTGNSANIGLRLAQTLEPLPEQPAVQRHTLPAPSPILEGVTIAAGAETLHLSGQVPSPIDPAKRDKAEDWGDTRTQTISVLNRIKDSLAKHGYTMSDVVKLTVFLVGDPRLGGKMDFAGMNAGYGEFFGTPANPALVARTTVQITALANPFFLVEIEAIAARAAPKRR